jgi:hypothetical protein
MKTVAEYTRQRRKKLYRRGICADCGRERRSRGHVLGEKCLRYRREMYMNVYKLRAAGIFVPAVSREQAEREFLKLTD